MYKKTILLMSLLTILISQAQNLKITYTDVYSLDAPEVNLQVFNSALFITSDKALYVAKIDSLEENGKKEIKKVFKDNDGKTRGIRTSSYPDGVYNYLDRKNKTLYNNARFNINFIYKEGLPKIKWQIKDETRKIEGITVQKAICKFRGRNYIAWFSKEIPIPLGPWKLNGLPGLIIEAHDTNKELLFLFKKLEYPYKSKINFPSLNKEWKTKEDLLKEREIHIERNLKFSRSLGQQFKSSKQGNEEELIKKSSFIELEF